LTKEAHGTRGTKRQGRRGSFDWNMEYITETRERGGGQLSLSTQRRIKKIEGEDPARRKREEMKRGGPFGIERSRKARTVSAYLTDDDKSC